MNAVRDGDRFEMSRPRARGAPNSAGLGIWRPTFSRMYRPRQERPVAAPKDDAAARADVDLIEQALQLLNIHVRYDDEPGRGIPGALCRAMPVSHRRLAPSRRGRLT